MLHNRSSKTVGSVSQLGLGKGAHGNMRRNVTGTVSAAQGLYLFRLQRLSRTSRDVHGTSNDFHGLLWTPTDFYGLPGLLWTSMDFFYGLPWTSRTSRDFCGLPWTSTDFQEFPWTSKTKSSSSVSDFMEFLDLCHANIISLGRSGEWQQTNTTEGFCVCVTN